MESICFINIIKKQKTVNDDVIYASVLLYITSKNQSEFKCNKPFNFQIKFVILLKVNHTILMMLIQRIQYWIN